MQVRVLAASVHRTPVRVAFLVVVAAVLTALFLGMPSASEATTHGATRSFSSSWVVPNGSVSVTLSVENFGLGQVVESLPEGFTFVSSNLEDAVVDVMNVLDDTSGDVSHQIVTFYVVGEPEIVYTVSAPEGLPLGQSSVHEFRGIARDLDGDEVLVSGDTHLRVGPEPTPIPSATPTRTPVPTATNTPTPQPTATATATPTPTPRPTSTPTPEPTATPLPTATPVPTPLPTSTPVPTATPTPTPLPIPEEESGGLPAWLLAIIIILVIGVLIGLIAFSRRQL